MPHSTRSINLHPSNLLPSSLSKTKYAVIVIGSGPAGHTVGPLVAAHNLSTLIIEDELIGGDCPFWACTPSKALLRPGEAIEATRQLGGARQLIDSASVLHEEGVFSRRDKFTHNWDDGWIVDMLKPAKVDLVRGRGSLIGEKKVRVTNVSGETIDLEAENAVVLATGSSPALPNIPGLHDINVWTPREATSSNHVPEHLVIVGGGVVGTEMATFYGNFTKKVTLITSNKALLPRFEPEASKRVKASLELRGVNVILSATVSSVRPEGKGGDSFSATLSNGEVLTGTTLLAATGRNPNTTNIGLDKFGITDGAKLEVDGTMCVQAPSNKGRWLFAVGDVNSLSPLTHMAIYQSRPAALTIVAQSKGQQPPTTKAWSDYSSSAIGSGVPQVVVTDPNIASAGLTLSAAQAQGLNVKAVVVPKFNFEGAWLHAELNYDGWAQWVIDVDRGVLVGATFVGREAGNLVHASTVAIVAEVPIKRLWHAVASFPTLTGIYTELLSASGY